MPGDRKEIGDSPRFITCDPLSRTFPLGWKDIWFRRQAQLDRTGKVLYTCPLCGRIFDHSMIDYLQGDHVWPYSMFGETSWENYQLICGSCNASKSNRLEHEIRVALGCGEFRRIVVEFLRNQVDAGTISDDIIVRSIVGTLESDEGTESDSARLGK